MFTPYQTQLDHLTRLAMDPGWKAYAWARALELEADQTGLWAGLSSALKQSVDQQKTKPR